MKTVIETLTEARILIENPANWVQHMHATNAGGDEINPEEPEAVCWCGDGALVKSSGAFFTDGDLMTEDTPYDAASLLLSDAIGEMSNGVTRSIATINDGDVAVHNLTPHKAVLQAFDRAIALASA